MTPRQFHALMKRKVEQWQREEVLFGNVAAQTANFSMSPPKKWLEADAFMMHPFKTNRAELPEPIPAGDGLLATLEAMPGTVRHYEVN